MDVVFLKGIKISAKHGVTEVERNVPQPFEIDVSVFGDFHEACVSDSIGSAVDYGDFGQLVVDFATLNSFSLIEALCDGIAQKILEVPRVLEVEVTVRKLRPPVKFELAYAGVTLRRGHV